MKVVQVADEFPHFDNRYMCEKCCCGPVHCQTGARRVGIFMAAMLFLSVLNAIAKGGIDFLSISILALEVLCTFMLFVGISKMNPRLVLPFVAFMFLALLTSMFFFVFLLIGASSANSAVRDIIKEHTKTTYLHTVEGVDIEEYVQMVCFFGAGAIFFGVLMNYWFFDVVRRCHNYLKDYEAYRLQFKPMFFEVKPIGKVVL